MSFANASTKLRDRTTGARMWIGNISPYNRRTAYVCHMGSVVTHVFPSASTAFLLTDLSRKLLHLLLFISLRRPPIPTFKAAPKTFPASSQCRIRNIDQFVSTRPNDASLREFLLNEFLHLLM